MSKLGLFDSIVETLQSAVVEPSHWSRAFKMIDEALGVHGSTTVYAQGDNSSDVNIFLFWYYLQGIRQLDLERLYLKDYYMDDERIPRIRRLPINEMVHIKDLYTESELKNSRAYNEAMKICRGQNSIHVRLDGPDNSRFTWVPNDPVDDEGWSSAKIDLLQNLLPHLRHNVCVHQSLAGAGVLSSTLAQLLDANGLGIIQLDGHGRIVEINDRCKSLLLSRETLTDRNGFLYTRHPQQNIKLQKLIARALPSKDRVGYGGTTKLLRWPKPSLLVQVHPVQAQTREARTWPIAALVVVRELPERPSIDVKTVARILNLTGMESRIAVMLTEGKNVPNIAKELGRKENTIRHHVKKMFAKHNISRQAELIDLVRPLSGAPKSIV